MKTMNILVAQGRGSMTRIADALRQEGNNARVTRCSGDATSAELLGSGEFDLLLLDLRNSYGEFPAVAEAFRRVCPGAPVLVAAGEPTGGQALEALRRGLCDFVVQPEGDDELCAMVRRLAGRSPAGPNVYSASGENRPTLYEMERSYILRTLEECKWNKKKTASVLGINRSSLYSKIKRFGIGVESLN
jgi:DNA-binding NtrC family response regulator